MSTDAVQALIDAGVIPTNPFGPSSRYRDVGIALYFAPGSERPVAYARRRFIPQPATLTVVAERVVHAGERPDGLAAAVLGEPELYWVLADANVVVDPFELTDSPGARLRVPAVRGG